MPKLPNTLSKGYLDNCSRSIIERYSGTEIGFFARFYVFKNILNMMATKMGFKSCLKYKFRMVCYG